MLGQLNCKIIVLDPFFIIKRWPELIIVFLLLINSNFSPIEIIFFDEFR